MEINNNTRKITRERYRNDVIKPALMEIEHNKMKNQFIDKLKNDGLWNMFGTIFYCGINVK